MKILEVFRNTNFEELKNLFDITKRLILGYEARILNVSTIDWKVSPWTVYSDSVLCLEKMQEQSEANQRWNAQLEEFQQSNSYRELFGIDGEPIEFEWNIYPGRASLEILQRIQKNLQDENIGPEHFEGRIIFMSTFNDIDWTKNGHSENCDSNSEHQCFERGILKKKRWQMYHTLQCGFIEHRTLVSHDSLSKSVQAGVKSWLSGFRVKKKKESTVEKFAAKENDQLLKNVKPQEVNFLWCKLQGATIGHLETDCENVCETLEKESQFTRVCGNATLARGVSLG